MVLFELNQGSLIKMLINFILKLLSRYLLFFLIVLDVIRGWNLGKEASENVIILVSRIFFWNFVFLNLRKNEFKNNNEKACSWSRNKVFHKIVFYAIWRHESIPTALELRIVRVQKYVWSHERKGLKEISFLSDFCQPDDFHIIFVTFC